MAEFTPIETQEQFDTMIAKRLERAEAKVRAEYADYDALKSSNAQLQSDYNTLKTESDNAKTTIADLNTKIAGLEASQLRTRIGLEHSIPLEMISRLTGTTEEEIKADAEQLSKFVAIQRPAPLKGEDPAGKGADAAFRALAANLGK